jgi:hypothetical protein
MKVAVSDTGPFIVTVSGAVLELKLPVNPEN